MGIEETGDFVRLYILISFVSLFMTACCRRDDVEIDSLPFLRCRGVMTAFSRRTFFSVFLEFSRTSLSLFERLLCIQNEVPCELFEIVFNAGVKEGDFLKVTFFVQ